jgi:HNH endonuclease
MKAENVEGKKVSVKGGGVCIYCGWDGGEQGLHDEHVVPYSLGGSTELLNASCSDCEAITSYLDGYMANAIFGHLRVHINLPSRSGHPTYLPAVIELADGQRAVDLATENHPFFLNLPIWRPPGFMIGKQIFDGFGEVGKFTYWYVPPNLRNAIGLKDGDIARVIDTSPPHNLNTFARGLAKIAYCNAVMKYGLDGFRPLATPDIILGKYQNIAYFVGSDPAKPYAPYPRGVQHSVGLGSIVFPNTKFLTATIRLFADSGAKDKGMPFYTVIYGAEGKHNIVPKRRLPRLPRTMLR